MIDPHHHCDGHATDAAVHGSAQAHSRRSVIVALASTAAGLSGPALAKSESSPEDERFMRMALDEARQGDYAFGCVITRGGELIARGRNLGKTNDDPTAHGEMVAIRRALADRGSAALRGATLHFRRAVHHVHGRDRLVRHWPAGLCRFGAGDRQAVDQVMITSAEVAARAKWDPIEITGGVLADEAVKLLGK
jgi:tRNA(adenine34) deaminase